MMTAEQLRDSILLLAMQGGLDTECASDKSITDVLKQIYSEKGTIKPINQDQIPYDLPKRWEWARLENITDNCDNPFVDGPFGSNLKKEHYTDKHEVRIIQLSNIGEKGWKDKNEKYTTYEHLKTIERSKVNAGDIVIAKMMPAGRAIEVPENNYTYVLSSDAVKFVAHPLLNKRFLLLAINSPVFREQVYSEVHGVTRVRTSLKKLKSYIVPLPPLEEQKRIVARMEELMPFVEQYAAVSTKLHTLNTSFPDMMKKSILQEAVQGKLVPQDPNDEPASELLKKITEEKSRLIKEGKIKNQKALPKITEEEIPFEIPESWEWVRLGDIGETCIGLTYKPSDISDISEEGITVLRSGNIRNGKMDYSDIVKVKCEVPSKTKISKGDILICARNGSRKLVGKSAIVDRNGMAFGAFMAKFHSKDVLNKYIQVYIESPLFRASLDGVGTETINQITQKMLKESLCPIPPIGEQKRIVKKIEELLPLCEKLH